MEYCNICTNKELNSQYHKDSVEHRFSFAIFQYQKYRKRLLKDDAHGITIDVKPKLRNNLILDFEYVEKRGKYTAKILTEQLVLHQNLITFQCSIHNKGNDLIYVISAILAHPSKVFQIVYDKNLNFRYGLDTTLALPPGSCYNFDVIFSVKDITTSEILIPLICNFQTVNNEVFTIPRAILVVVTSVEEENETKTKSPFTRQRWENVKTVDPTQKLHYAINYPIPRNYLKLLKFGLQQFSSITAREEDTLLELQRNLSELRETNYSKYWHITLWLEEVAQSLMLQKYNMENVTLSLKQDNILVLEVPGLAEKRPSIIFGDMIDIRLHDDHTAFRGIVKRINDKTVDIFYVDQEFINYIKQNSDTQLDVAFTLNRLYFERMHGAVDKVTCSMLPAVFPDDVHRPPQSILNNIRFYNTKIVDNPEQKNAVIQIINSTHVAPYVLFGPPGTGKTVTIVEAILQIKKHTNKRILVCAPANSACDNIAIMLLPHCSTSELIRIHSDTRETSTLTKALMRYSNMEEEGVFKKMSVGEVMKFRIVVTTLTLIGRYRDYKPDCVFVDEAAQACEPETAIAIGFLEAGQQVVLAGDPKQLGPMVSSKCAEKYGLGISLLARLMEFAMYKIDVQTGCYNSNFITMLKLNFRSHPNILAIPNEFFYNNSLISMSVKAQNDPIASIAIFRQTEAHRKNHKVYPGNALEFCSVSSRERREGSSPSYFNPAEVRMVLRYVQALMNLNLEGDHKVQLDHIGVITPYKRQVHKIKDMLQKNGFEGIEVGTTEAYQGREKRIIIISTVRAQRSLLLHDRKYDLGFVRHEQRFNVAVTRAMSKLIVIGCQTVLSTDTRWEKFIELCRQYKTYFGVPYVKRDSEWKGEVVNRLKHLKSRDNRVNHTSSQRK